MSGAGQEAVESSRGGQKAADVTTEGGETSGEKQVNMPGGRWRQVNTSGGGKEAVELSGRGQKAAGVAPEGGDTSGRS